MRFLIYIFVIVIFPFFIQSPEAEPVEKEPEERAEYCNSRFNFCLSYPSSLLPIEVISDNGDGVSMYTQDESIQVTVYGNWAALDKSCDELYEQYIGKKVADNPNAQLSYVISTAEYFEAFYTLGNKAYYRKHFCRGSQNTEIYIQASVEDTYRMNLIKDKIDLDF